MAARRALHVIATGALTTVQDLADRGWPRSASPGSGAADRDALRLANRLLGNAEDEAALEVTLGGLVLRCVGGATVAVTGAPCPVGVAGRMASRNTTFGCRMAPSCGWAPRRARGVAKLRWHQGRVAPAEGAGLALERHSGPARSSSAGPGQLLGLRDARGWPPGIEVAPVRDLAEGEVRLRVQPGPRRDWFTPEAYDALLSAPSGDCGQRPSRDETDRAEFSGDP